MAVGARILDAVTRTLDVAGCNTNLGIVLLCAPLAAALDELTPPRNASRWHEAAERTLERLDLDDARAAYRAIALANPGGLGDAPEQSVHAEPSVDLRAAMTLAAERDSIARQYASGFRDIFQTGLGAVASAPPQDPGDDHAQRVPHLPRHWPDSHIVRKQGVTVAQSVTREARAASRSMAHRVGARRDAAAPRLGRRTEGAGHQPGHERRSHGRDAVRRRMHRAGTPRHRRERAA